MKQINDGQEVVVHCDADCCSYTWIENIELPAKGLPAKILDVKDLDMPDLGDLEGCDVVAYYGCQITTENGDIVMIFCHEF